MIHLMKKGLISTRLLSNMTYQNIMKSHLKQNKWMQKDVNQEKLSPLKSLIIHFI